MYSAPANSTSLPPTSLFPSRMAPMTFWSGTLVASRASGSTFTWYCFWNPPIEATSATPGTLWSQ